MTPTSVPSANTSCVPVSTSFYPWYLNSARNSALATGVVGGPAGRDVEEEGDGGVEHLRSFTYDCLSVLLLPTLIPGKGL